MLFVSLIRWWYGDGWRRRARIISSQIDGVIDYFSIDLLAKTLFAPFRQISAGRVDGPLGVKLRAFADRLISRFIGALIRSVLLIMGLIAIAGQVLFGGLLLLLWAFVPLLPFIGVGAAIAGWTP